ncbi:hypothetical protein GTY86_22040 [Streptomyces sp. SID5770]|uniref:hypothetical protein n=1 Tax=Streptomyces sp. SID5770 TaxID=2690308 RepID=UPI00136D47B1|nr:hypothetical protein [Streptomyces sp. SID5770]
MTRLLRGTTDRTPETPETLETPVDPETPEPDGKETRDAPDTSEDEDAGGDGDSGGNRFTPRWRTIVLVTALTALLLGGSAFFHGAHQLRSTPAARNQALTDTAATVRVGGDVGEGLARIFSYAPARADAAERSAASVLSGRAARQYTELFAQVRESLTAQRLTLTTQAVRTGVIELKGNTARLLVFLDQTSRRDGAPATSAAAQLTVTAEFRDDRWLIVDIKAR